jgi:hypothetical protein
VVSTSSSPARPRQWSWPLTAVAVAAVVALAAGCRDGAASGDSATASTTAESTTTTAVLDPSQPQTATVATGNPRDDRIGPPADNRPADGTLAAVGTCFVEYLEPQGDTLLHRLGVTDCATPHDAEVFAVLDMESPPTAPFPGETEVLRRADRLCLSRFDAYVGGEYATSSLRIAVLRPTATTWATGDRRVVCSLYDQDLEPLSGSTRGSRR